MLLYHKEKETDIISISLFHRGGVGETRTLAPVNPIYFLSREAPSPTWVLLQVNAPYLNIKGDYK